MGEFDVIRHRHHDRPVFIEFELICDDPISLLLDPISIELVLFDLAEIPRDDELSGRGNDGRFLVAADVESGGSEGDMASQEFDVLRQQLEPARDRLVWSHRFLKSSRNRRRVFRGGSEGSGDEEEISLAGGQHPQSILRRIDSDYGISESREVGFGREAKERIVLFSHL